VLLADDHVVLRAGTRRILEDEPDLTVVGEASDGPTATALAERTQPDVVLLDISMPQGDGIAAFPELRRVAPRARLLVLSAHDKLAYLRAFYRLGADGYLLKSARPEELVSAIRRVYAGERVYAAAIAGQMRVPQRRSQTLTEREVEIIRLVADGSTNRELAEALHLSESTIEYHLRNIYAKLGATYRADAVVIAQRQGWLDSPEPLC
jgi:DNA-binding NarL/FixJ family response regulator